MTRRVLEKLCPEKVRVDFLVRKGAFFLRGWCVVGGPLFSKV